MAKIDLFDPEGKKTGHLALPEEIFGVKVNEILLAQAVRVYLANQRRARAKTKTRGEVRGSRKKIWRQKGTGRARHGARSAPIFVGGGKAHGPTGQQNYQLKLTKKMKRQALFSALASKLAGGEIGAVRGLEKVEPKTKKMALAIGKIARVQKWDPAKEKITLVLPEVLENVTRSARNLAGVELKQADSLNPYEVLNAGRLLFMEKSLEVLKDTYLKTKERKTDAAK